MSQREGMIEFWDVNMNSQNSDQLSVDQGYQRPACASIDKFARFA